MNKNNQLPPQTQTDPRLVGIAKIFSEAAGIIVFLVGVLALIGWQFNLAVFKSVSSGFVAMKPNTALGLIFLGASLWFLQEKRSKHWVRYLGWTGGVASILIGATAVLEYLLGLDLGIDNLLFTEATPALFTIYPGRMALNTAFNFIFFGISILFLNVKIRRGLCLSSIPAILGGTVSLLVIIGYVYDIREFYLVEIFYTPMALHTALAFFLASWGILFARPESRLTKVFVSGGSVGITIRRLLPLALVVPLGFGLLEEFGHHYGFYSTEFGRSLISVSSVAVLTILVWLNAVLMERKETERARIMENLRREKNFSQAVIDALPGVFSFFDDKQNLKMWNKNLETVTGYSGEELVKRKAANFFVGRDQEVVVKSINECLITGKSECEAVGVDKAGKKALYFFSSRCLKINGQPHIVSWGVDISRIKQAEEKIIQEKEVSQALAKDLEKFKLAVDGASDMIVIDDVEGRLLYCNKALETITGYTPEEALNKKTGSLWGHHMPTEFYTRMWDIIKNQKKSFVGEITNRRKNGQDYTAEVHISPILDKNGRVQFFVGIERDITKAKELEKLRSEFVSVTSHQLRTPLTAIKWHLELLLDAKLPRKEKIALRQIFSSNERMIKLVGDLLDVSRIEEGKKFAVISQKVDIASLIKEVVSDQMAAARDYEVAIKPDTTLPKKLELLIDGDKMRQVFQNLIDNAIKYSLPGGEIIIGYQPAAGRATFYVKDNGVGVPKNQQDRVFQKFFRADNVSKLKGQGTGLGLYIVKAIVEGHGGEIWFDSEENKGTTFYFSLPVGG